MIITTPKVCVVESRYPINVKANNMVNTVHRFIAAAMIDTLPISRPLKKNKYPAEYSTAAIKDKPTAMAGISAVGLKIMASRNMEISPDNCDQNRDLKGPICLAKTPPRKS